MCNPPCPPANRTTAAFGACGDRTTILWVTPARVGMSTTFWVTCANAWPAQNRNSDESRTTAPRQGCVAKIRWIIFGSGYSDAQNHKANCAGPAGDLAYGS